MRRLACLLLLAGCDTVFGFEDVEPFDALCLGRNGEAHAGLFDHCLTAQPPADLAGVIDIDTDDDTMCSEVVAQADADRTEVCIVAARNVEINVFLAAHGKRPLVLAAVEALRVTSAGTVSVASVRRAANGAGSNFIRCANGLAGTSTTGTSGGAGAAGGSFQGLGGAGGAGNGNVVMAQPQSEVEPGFVRGGCQGGVGGSSPPANGGNRGTGGGALYVMAGRTITIEGGLNASGEGGEGGDGGNSSGGGGGGGGGSGGLIGLDAPYITLAASARLAANGGGGGGGGSSTQPGKNGVDADLTGPFPFTSYGGDGGSTNAGGRGGTGGFIDSAALPGASYSLTAGGAAGGGGGGSTGYIKLFGISITDEGASVTPANG